MVQVTIHEAPSRWLELLHALDRGEEVFVGDAHRRVRLVGEQPVPEQTTQRPERPFGAMRGQIQMAPNFDEPDFDLTEYGP